MQSLGLEKVLWIPTGKPGYRTPPVASAFDRVTMLSLALKDEPDFEIDSRELAPGASPYTVDTLALLHADRPDDEFYLLLSFRRWRRPNEVKRLARLAVFTRPGYQVAPGDAIDVRMTPLAISGSAIRARAARGESLEGLVPPAVANYITENKLYR
jgi:nicotinate-nucleotide adenylyltransferase